MAQYLKNIDGRNEPVTIKIPIAASQTVVTGDLIETNGSGKGELAVAGSTTLVGIAQNDITTGATVDDTDAIPVILIDGIVFRIATTNGDIADTDLYGDTAFDLSDEKTLDAGTTGGMLKVLAYDNDNDTANVICARANYALA